MPSYRRKPGVAKSSTAALFRKTGEFLVIVESPSKCASIAAYLGSQYNVIASLGHIAALESLADVDVAGDFSPTFRVPADKREHVAWMRAAIAQFPPENILLASDSDREGEAIAHHIATEFGLPPLTKRIIFNEITRAALTAAVAAPGTINTSLVAAQQARQVLDIVIGFGVSPVLWKHLYHSKTNALSAGRCQTPALRLIYDHYKENAAVAASLCWRITGTFFAVNLPMVLDTEFDSSEETAAFVEETKAHAHIASMGESRRGSRAPPQPMNTAALLQSAGSMLRWSPKKTMQVAQQLYQAGFITYMRTESRRYSREFLAATEKFLLDRYKGDRRYVGETERIVSGGKGASADPHEAVRVTDLESDGPGRADPSMAALYQLIRGNTVESCMSPEIHQSYPVEISAPRGFAYRYSYEDVIFPGWTRFSRSAKEPDASPYAGILLILKTLAPGSAISYGVVRARPSERGGHAHYSETSLVKKLEELGIGRPSTYAMLVETVQERGYVSKKDVAGKEVVCAEYVLRRGEPVAEIIEESRVFGAEKGKLVLQPVGELCIEFLSKHFRELFDYGYTGEMERALDAVAAATEISPKNTFSVCASAYAAIRAQIAAIGKIKKRAYPIDAEHALEFGPFGACIAHRVAGGKKAYLPIKESVELDIARLSAGGYTAEELVKVELLGEHAGAGVYMRSGKYGPYVECGDVRRGLPKHTTDITLDGALEVLLQEDGGGVADTKNVIRVLDSACSIRKGRFGHYVFYKTVEMTKPQFLSLKKFKGKYFDCAAEDVLAWVHKMHITKAR